MKLVMVSLDNKSSKLIAYIAYKMLRNYLKVILLDHLNNPMKNPNNTKTTLFFFFVKHYQFTLVIDNKNSRLMTDFLVLMNI